MCFRPVQRRIASVGIWRVVVQHEVVAGEQTGQRRPAEPRAARVTVTGGSSGRTTRRNTSARSSTASRNRPFIVSPVVARRAPLCATPRCARQAMRFPGTRPISYTRRRHRMPRAPRIAPKIVEPRVVRPRPGGWRGLLARPSRLAGTLRRPTAAAFSPVALFDHRAGLGRAGGRGDAAVVRPRPAAPGSGPGRRPPPQPDAGRTAPAMSSPPSAIWSVNRCAWPTCRAICPKPRWRWRTGGSGTTTASTRSAWPVPPGPTSRAGRVVQGGSTHHPAGRQEPVPDQRPHVPPQGAGTVADAVAGSAFQQAGDPRDLAEPGLSGVRRLGHRRGLANVFRRLGAPRDAVAGGGAGGAAAGAVALQSSRRPSGSGAPGRGRC